MNKTLGETFTLGQSMRLTIDTVTTGNGQEWIPLYTDEEEMTRKPTTNISINMSMVEVIKSAYYDEKVEGLVINPFGPSALTVPKNILKILVERYDEIEDIENERC